MKKSTLLITLCALVALPVWAASVADDLKSAAKKLSEQSYSWTLTSDTGQPAGGGAPGRGRGGFFGGGTSSGQVDKEGFALLSFTNGDTTSQAALKGEKVAVKVGDEWKSGAELTADTGDDRPNRNRLMAQRMQRTKLPAAEVQDLAGKVKELKKDGDTFSGDLPESAVKEVFSFGGRRGGDAGANAGPDTSGIKGAVKFWVKDGVLSKYETRYTGKMSVGRGGGETRDFDMNRTTTVEIKDVGTTKVALPDEAKKKL